MADNTVTKVKIESQVYELDAGNLTWGEMSLLEQTIGKPIGQVDFESATAVLALAWIARRRVQPTVTYEDMQALPMDAIEVLESDPTPAVEDGAVTTDDGTGNQS